jgi:Leucine-rich repeat (LRR) protein
VEILASEKPFFAGIARQIDTGVDALLRKIGEQITKADRYTRPCLEFDEKGHVRRLDLVEFPGVSYSEEKVRVDCSPLEWLEELRAFNVDLEITTRKNERLRSVDIAFCGQRQLDLPVQIEELECPGNPLEGFDASRFPRLRRLNCIQTPLETLDVSPLRELEDLSCGWNDNGYYRDDAKGPRLTRLLLGDSPKLESVNAVNWLYPGTPKGKRLTELNVSGLRNLTSLGVADCELRALDLRNNEKLRILNCSNNPIEVLDLEKNPLLEGLYVDGTALASLNVSKLTALTTLHCGGRKLKRLTLDAATALRTLNCKGAAIDALELSGQNSLARLWLTQCDLKTLDIRGAGKLREVTLTGCRKLTQIRCSEHQKHTIPALRTFFKLSKPTKDPAKMDPFALHEFIAHYNWDGGTKALFKAIRNPSCSLASALVVYWGGRPDFYLRYPDDRAALADHADRDVLKLLREIEKRVRDGEYEHHEHIEWVCGDQADDHYPESTKLRSIPEHMSKLSKVDHRVG